MIFHIREEEKKVVQTKSVDITTLITELETLLNKLDIPFSIKSDVSGLLKFIKKGRFNFLDNKVLLELNIKLDGVIDEQLRLVTIEKDNGFYIETLFNGHRINEGLTEIRIVDNLSILSTVAIVDRVQFKLAEIIFFINNMFEKDKEKRKGFQDIANTLHWYGELKESEVESVVTDLKMLESDIGNINSENIKVTTDINSLAKGFKKFRSEKTFFKIEYDIKGEKFTDKLWLVKKNGTYFYEILLTKKDNYKDNVDVSLVYEQRELTPYGFERFVRDLAPVFIANSRKRIDSILAE